MDYFIYFTFFLFGFVLGEQKNMFFGYWEDLRAFLDKRDEEIIKKLKK